MSRIILDYDQAHNFVEKNKTNGFFWDNYTIVKFSPHSAAYMDKKGSYKNNKWGFANRYEVKRNGTWELSEKYVKLI